MLVKIAKEITGGLSNPSKMPGHGYSLPAKECKMGSQLAKIPGTTCHNCYALKGRYGFPAVQDALYRRLESLKDPRWVEAMVTQIKSTGDKYFRWHDSGDLQSVDHLKLIAEVCRQTPSVKHWLPTREYATVQQYLTEETVPSNLTIRLSAHKVNAQPPTGYGLPTSTVHTKDQPHIGTLCEAFKRENQCGPCRACWDKRVANVSYKKH